MKISTLQSTQDRPRESYCSFENSVQENRKDHYALQTSLILSIFEKVLEKVKFAGGNPLKGVPESHGRQAEEKTEGSPKLGHQGSPGIDQHL